MKQFRISGLAISSLEEATDLDTVGVVLSGIGGFLNDTPFSVAVLPGDRRLFYYSVAGLVRPPGDFTVASDGIVDLNPYTGWHRGRSGHFTPARGGFVAPAPSPPSNPPRSKWIWDCIPQMLTGRFLTLREPDAKQACCYATYGALAKFRGHSSFGGLLCFAPVTLSLGT